MTNQFLVQILYSSLHLCYDHDVQLSVTVVDCCNHDATKGACGNRPSLQRPVIPNFNEQDVVAEKCGVCISGIIISEIVQTAR